MKTHHRIVAAAITIAISSVAPSSSSERQPSMTSMSQSGATPVVTEVAPPRLASIASWRTRDDPNPKELKITAWLILLLKEGRAAR
jgi:hypothetical protein